MSKSKTAPPVLVTGGAGFIGSCFVRRWLTQEPSSRCVVVDKLTYAGDLSRLDGFRNHPQFEFHQLDICEETSIRELLVRHKIDWVVNFAAETHVDRSISGPAPFLQSNVMGTFHLLSACRQHFESLSPETRSEFRFLQISTDEVYGSIAEGKFTEESNYQPNSPYSASKAAADHFVRAYHQTYGLPVLTTHSGNNFGPFQQPDKLIPLAIQRALNGQSIPVYGDGKHVRDWIYVEDHCDALMHVLKNGAVGEHYNISADDQLENLETLAKLENVLVDLTGHSNFPASFSLESVADRLGHDRRYASDSSRIRHLGQDWQPLKFDVALRKTVQWYLQNRVWLRIARC